MLVALDVNLSIDRTPAARLPWRGLIVFGAPCMADSGVLVKYSLRHRVIASSERFLTSVTETNLLESLPQ